jgi:DNA primase
MWRAPDPRRSTTSRSSQVREVVLVEGEKCADALIACGIAATTAMNGAKAPDRQNRLASLGGNPW